MFAGNTGHFDDEIDLAGSEGLAGMKVGAPRGQTDGGIAHSVAAHTEDTCCKTGAVYCLLPRTLLTRAHHVNGNPTCSVPVSFRTIDGHQDGFW